MPMARLGSDPSELAIPWRMLTNAGHAVTFATPDGNPGEGDPRMLHGTDLAIWKPILRADANARSAYAEMERSKEFQAPITYAAMSADYDALVLPGGHDKPIREYLESAEVQAIARAYFAAKKPVGAICHGVLVVGRAGLLAGRKTTSLTNALELAAYRMTKLWLKDYYRTYPATTEDEVRSYGCEYFTGPGALFRDSPEHLDRGFIVRDGHYVSARWPGDAHRFSAELIGMLKDSA